MAESAASEAEAHGPAVVTTSWDDGDPLDAKLADLLREFGLKGTFYVAPRNRERATLGPDALRELARDFEVGAHTLTHPSLIRLPGEEVRREMRSGREALQGILGRPVEMFCYPKGGYDAAIRRAAVQTGFVGARTTRTFHIDWRWEPWSMPTTICFTACPRRVWYEKCLLRADLGALAVLTRIGLGGSWAEAGTRLFELALRRGGLWHLWGHSWDIEEQGLWQELRRLLEAVARRPGVRYLTNAEVVRLRAGREARP